jgi:hypothetical protein
MDYWPEGIITEEDVRYSYRQRYIDNREGPTLPIGEMVISQKCLKGCSYCGIDARPKGALMPLDLFYQVVDSYQTTLILPTRQRIFLGDAEVIIHPDLTEMVQYLNSNSRLTVQFTTAGLLPKNQKIGAQNLERLGELRARLKVTLTLDILHGIPMEEYTGYMKETIKLLFFLGDQLGVNTISDGKNGAETIDWVNRITGLGLKHAPEACPIGRGMRMNFLKENSERIEEECGLIGDFRKYTQPTFSIRPNGDVSVHCCGLGATRGPTLGNVYLHDAKGIHEQYELFLQEHMERCRTKPPNMHVCECHRTWKKKFVPEKSRCPIVKQRKIVAGLY